MDTIQSLVSQRMVAPLGFIMGLLLLTGCGTLGVIDVAAEQNEYQSVSPFKSATLDRLDEGSDVPARIAIASIGLDTSIENLGWSATIGPAGRIFNNWDVTDFAAGWHVNSNSPGQGGNVVLSGHNNIQGAVFRELDQLKAGDVATVWSGDGRYDYEITDVFVVPEHGATPEQRRQNASWIGEFNDDRLTLVTCWPRDGNSHRIIAIGHKVTDSLGAASNSAAGQ